MDGIAGLAPGRGHRGELATSNKQPEGTAVTRPLSGQDAREFALPGTTVEGGRYGGFVQGLPPR